MNRGKTIHLKSDISRLLYLTVTIICLSHTHLDLHAEPEGDNDVPVDLTPDVHHCEHQGRAQDGDAQKQASNHQTHSVEEQHEDIVGRRASKIAWVMKDGI